MVMERFGILRHQHPISFSGGMIVPVDDFDEALADVAEATHRDGYIYPPTQKTVREVYQGDTLIEEEVPRSERPALLYPVIATHTVSVESPLEADFKRGDGGFLVHLAAYLFGARVQFAEWLIDGRVPIEYPTHAVHVQPGRASAFFTVAYDTWRTWPFNKRRPFTTALYMHSKAPAYEWLWESFLMEYMTFDALWKLSGLPSKGHAARIEQLCALYNLPYDANVADEMAKLRNNLVHEAIWEGDAPGFAVTQQGWQCNRRLRMLNQRVIAAQVGWTGSYVQSNWIHSQFFCFFE